MKELYEEYFYRHTYMALSKVNDLFEHRAKRVDVDALDTKLKDQYDTLNKKSKYIKHMKSLLDSCRL